MKVLAVDTAFDGVGISLTVGRQPLANYYSLCRKRTATVLFEVLPELLSSARMKLEDVDLYVVNQGPGSYTGVRIGMSFMKTLAQVHQKPLMGIPSLPFLATLAEPVDFPFYVVLNCTRTEVFYARYRNSATTVVAETEIHWSVMEEMGESFINQPVLLKHIPTHPSPLFDPVPKIPQRTAFPDPYQLGRLGEQIHEIQGAKPLIEVQPLYIKKEV